MDGVAAGVRDGSSLEGIHLLWYGPAPWGYAPKGYTILRRTHRRGAGLACDRLEGAQLEAFHTSFVYQLPHALLRWRPADCPVPPSALPTEDVRRLERPELRTVPEPARDLVMRVVREHEEHEHEREESAAAAGRRHAAAARRMNVAIAAPPTGVAVPKGCRRYRFDLSRPQPHVRLTMGTPAMLVVALRGPKAVRAELVSGPGISHFELSAPGITQLLAYTPGTRFVELCVPGKPSREQLDWSGAEVLAKGLQLPVREADPALGSFDDELAAASGRMLQPPGVSAPEFKTLAGYLRHLVASRPAPPSEHVLLERDRTGGFQEFGLLALALLPQLDGDGRRLLGLAYRDDFKLVAGRTYDYRITAEFPEIDLTDRVLGFSQVPGGTVLPRSFYLGDVRLRLPAPTPVRHHPPPGPGRSAHVARRGIRLDATATPSLRVEFSTPVQELTLEFAPEDGAGVTVRALGAAFLGLGSVVDERTVAAGPRTVLRYDDPVERLELTGGAFFHGLRLHGVTGSRRDEDRRVPVTLDLPGVSFDDSPLPSAPSTLAVENLQTPLVPVEPATSGGDPPHRLGFRLRWRQPIEGGTPLWPPGEPFAPPVAATTFVIERRRVDDPSPWRPLDVRNVLGARQATDGVTPLTADVDLVEFFSPEERGVPPDDFFTYDDVLDVPPVDGQPAGERQPPGSLWQYRVAAVDLIGRRSAGWTSSPVVRLEKRVPPPPPAPPARALPEDRAQVLGVEARLVQRADPDVPAAERDAVLGAAHDNAIVLRWSWPDEARDQDPYAREFRVYVRQGAGTTVAGQLTAVTPSADGWDCRIDWDRPLGADALAGLRLRSGGHPFRIGAHEAGRLDVPTRLGRLNLDPGAAPQTGDVALTMDTAGAEHRPALFDERVETVAITAATDYEAVLFDRVAVDADTQRQTVWVGVSSADDQVYVGDAVPAGAANGGRPGNESQVVARTVSARYHGQPAYAVPDPLAAVPERVTDEPRDGRVRVALPLPALVRTAPGQPPLTGADRVQLERLAASELSQRLSAADGDGFDIRLPDGSTAALVLGNPGDRATLRAQLATGEPARVDARYLRQMLVQHAALGELFTREGPPVAFGDTFDTLPGQAERYLFRIRRVDAAGHSSAGAALLDEVVRVPSLARLGAPTLEVAGTQDDRVRVRLTARASVELRWLVLFHRAEPLDSPPGERPAAHLVRLPNRRDLLPAGGYRLRLGSVHLDPHPTEVQPGDVADGQATVDVEQVVGHGLRVDVWALALSRDGIPSLVAGPRAATTARPPVAAATPTVTRVDARAVITWPPVAADHEVRVQSDGGTGTWRPVTAWLGAATTAVERRIADPAERFRLVVRARDGRSDTGAAVPVPGA